MSSINLAWGSAEVEDGTLTVALEGDLAKDWKQSFERTVTLLGDGEWGEVRLKKGVVQVSDVVPGTEDKLRHYLESIVTQANAAHERRQAPEEQEGRTDEEPEGPDAEMTEHFRAFAEPRPEAGN
jgi:hypothetical protein